MKIIDADDCYFNENNDLILTKDGEHVCFFRGVTPICGSILKPDFGPGVHSLPIDFIVSNKEEA